MVMGRGGQQVVGKTPVALAAAAVERQRRGAEVIRVEANVAAREQNRRAITGGVLHGFGRCRRGQLLEARQGLLPQPALGAGRHLA